MKLEKICHISSGGTPSRGKSHFYGGDIPWAKISDIENSVNGILTETEEKITGEGLKSIGNKIFPKGTLLFAMYGSIGKVAITGQELATNQAILGIRPKGNKEIYLPYLKVWFESNKKKLINQGRGVALQNLSATIIRNLEVPLPPFSDQLQIANILSKAENLISQRKQSIGLLDEFLKSTFLEMFGDASTNKLKWDKVELKKFGKVITGNTPPRNNNENFSSDFIEWIKTDNIHSDKTYITKAIEYLSESGLKNSRTVEHGALLVACIAGSIESVGRAGLANRKVSFNQQINAIQPHKDIEPLFLYWLFKISKKYVQNHATKGMKKILTKGEFEKILMIKPPLSLQVQFSQIAAKTEALKAHYQSSLHELENLYGSLSQRAFRGELAFLQNEEEQPSDIVETEKTDLISEKIVPVVKEKKEKDEVDISKKSTKKIIPDLQPVATHREIIKQSYKINNTIKTHYNNRYFTFEEFTKKLIESGHDYKFEAIRNEIFNLLRENKLRQIFADAAFKNSFDKTHPDYNEVQKLEERIYLTLKSERQ